MTDTLPYTDHFASGQGMYKEFTAERAAHEASASPPEMHSTTRSLKPRHAVSLENMSEEHEQDLLGAIFREHEVVNHQNEATAAIRTRGPTAVEVTQNAISEVAAPSVAEILLQKGDKKGKKSHARKQPNGHIPRPRNAFILFRKHITDNDLIPPSVEVKHQNISVVVIKEIYFFKAAKMWAEAPPSVKTEFTEAARIEKAEHARLYPNYRYQPAYRRTDIVRRRVRKDPIEDQKCDAVANLLIQGASGDQLETEVKETLAQQAPEPVAPEQIKLVNKRGRRRRKDAPGELSKGAVRAQRAAARAKAMRDQWMDTNILLNGMQARNMASKRATLDNQHIGRQFAGHPMYLDAYDMPNDDGLYEEGYEMPYELPPDQYDDEMFYRQAAMRAPALNFHPDDQFSPLDDRPGEYIWEQQQFGCMNAAPPLQHPQDYGMFQPIQNQARQMGQADFHETVYHQMPAYPMDTIDGGRLETPRTAGRFDAQPVEPMLTAYLPPDPEPEAIAYGYPPFDSPLQAQQNDIDQAHPFLEPLPDNYGTTGRPGDIIAGRWAQQVGQTDWDLGETNDFNPHYEEDNAPFPAGATDEQDSKEPAGNSNSWFPLVDNNVLPSEGIDFGEQPRLFDGIWEQEPPILPLDPDMEDYQQAVREQEEMQMLTAR